ncbi:MAG: hypothetical protein NWF07_13760 [Candidatus Bathyarchaeota archaeon]|nr:hypothetical protein [Candidatus Bathyarchaeota archaeon]
MKTVEIMKKAIMEYREDIERELGFNMLPSDITLGLETIVAPMHPRDVNVNMSEYSTLANCSYHSNVIGSQTFVYAKITLYERPLSVIFPGYPNIIKRGINKLFVHTPIFKMRVVQSLAHELRHVHQGLCGKLTEAKTIENFLGNSTAYQSQDVEVDAIEFADKFVKRKFKSPLSIDALIKAYAYGLSVLGGFLSGIVMMMGFFIALTIVLTIIQ